MKKFLLGLFGLSFIAIVIRNNRGRVRKHEMLRNRAERLLHFND